MNSELEALLRALDELKEARLGTDAARLREEYEELLNEVLRKNPKLTTATLEQAVRLAYSQWIQAGKKHPSPPPKA